MSLKVKKNFDSKENIVRNVQILMEFLAKISQNIFAYSLVSEHSKHFFILRKKCIFLAVGGG